MDVRFKPHVTERRFKKLAYGTPGLPGLVSSWVGLDISTDLDGQYRLATQARKLLGLNMLTQVLHATFGAVFTGVIRQPDLEFICWRVAANIDTLLSDSPLPPWSGLRSTVIAPVQIVHTRRGWSAANKPRYGYFFTFQVIDGELCPVRFRRWLPPNFLFVLASDLGLSGWRMAGRYEGHAPQLYGMRFVATMSPSRYDPREITFERHTVGQFEEYNKRLARRRSKPCPIEYDWECYECTLGENHCPDKKPTSRACRPVSLEVINCSRCGEATPQEEGDCLRCHRRGPVTELTGERDDRQT